MTKEKTISWAICPSCKKEIPYHPDLTWEEKQALDKELENYFSKPCNHGNHD